MQANKERSLGELFSDLRDQIKILIREEMELARTEMSGKFSRAIKDLVFLIAGGMLAYTGVLALLAALVLGLATGMKGWLAAIIAGVLVCAVGIFLIGKGISELKKIKFKPSETIKSLQEDKKMVKEEAKWLKAKV